MHLDFLCICSISVNARQGTHDGPKLSLMLFGIVTHLLSVVQFVLWRDVLSQHAKEPLHAMVGGGDQIYNDEVFSGQLVQEWLHSGRKVGQFVFFCLSCRTCVLDHTCAEAWLMNSWTGVQTLYQLTPPSALLWDTDTYQSAHVIPHGVPASLSRCPAGHPPSSPSPEAAARMRSDAVAEIMLPCCNYELSVCVSHNLSMWSGAMPQGMAYFTSSPLTVSAGTWSFLAWPLTDAVPDNTPRFSFSLQGLSTYEWSDAMAEPMPPCCMNHLLHLLILDQGLGLYE